MLREALAEAIGQASLPQLLRYQDRNSMAASIESRVPFLTPALAEFVISLPEDYLVRPPAGGKAVFRAAMAGLVPQAILDRRDKIGFATSELDYLRRAGDWVERTLDAGGDTVPLQVGKLRRQWRRMRDGREPLGGHIWRSLNLICWANRTGVSF